jgi:MFS family permease
VFLIANGFSFLGSVLCATAVSSTMLIVGRAVAGIGTAGLDAGAFIMLVQSTPLRKRPTFLGLWAAIEGLSTIAGPLLGGAITQTIGWRWCFYINLPIGGATLLLTFLCFSEALKASDVARLTFKEKFLQLDVISNLILVSALTCLFLAFSWAGAKYPWHSGRVIGLVITFGVLAAAFIYNQFRRGDAAVLPIRIVKRRTVIASLVFITFLNSAGNVLEYYLPIYYQAVRGYTPAQSGLLMLPILVAATLGAIGSGIGTSACGYYAPFMIFASVTMPIAAGLVTTFKIDTGLAKIIVYTGLSGLGYGVGSSGPVTAVQTVLLDGDVPLGISVLLFGSAFGPAVTIAIAQVIFTNQLSNNLNGLLLGLGRTSIESNGLTELVKQVPHGMAGEVLSGIDKSVAHTWYLVIGLTCAMFFGILPIEWRSVKKENPNQE